MHGTIRRCRLAVLDKCQRQDRPTPTVAKPPITLRDLRWSGAGAQELVCGRCAGICLTCSARGRHTDEPPGGRVGHQTMPTPPGGHDAARPPRPADAGPLTRSFRPHVRPRLVSGLPVHALYMTGV